MSDGDSQTLHDNTKLSKEECRSFSVFAPLFSPRLVQMFPPLTGLLSLFGFLGNRPAQCPALRDVTAGKQTQSGERRPVSPHIPDQPDPVLRACVCAGAVGPGQSHLWGAAVFGGFTAEDCRNHLVLHAGAGVHGLHRWWRVNGQYTLTDSSWCLPTAEQVFTTYYREYHIFGVFYLFSSWWRTYICNNKIKPAILKIFSFLLGSFWSRCIHTVWKISGMWRSSWHERAYDSLVSSAPPPHPRVRLCFLHHISMCRRTQTELSVTGSSAPTVRPATLMNYCQCAETVLKKAHRLLDFS